MDTTASREHGYHDRPELTVDGIVDLDDHLELAAIAMHRMTFATPDEVASMFGSRPAELVFTWTRLEPAARHLWRRRAAVALEAAPDAIATRARHAAAAAVDVEELVDELVDVNDGAVVQPA